MSTYFLSVEEELANIRRQLDCTEESLKKDVQYLREWLEQQPHLPNWEVCFSNENSLRIILLNCKNSLEKTKLAIEKYFIIRALHPETFHDRNPLNKNYECVTEMGMVVPLRKLTPDGYRVVVFYLPENIRTIKYAMAESFFKLVLMAIDTIAKYDYAKGYIIFVDGRYVTLSLITPFSSIIQKSFSIFKKGLTANIKKCYVCNMGRTTDIIIALMKAVGEKKFMRKIEVLKNSSDLSNMFPKGIIPQDYGGDELSMEELKNMWYQEQKNNSEFLIMSEKIAADLTKIPKDRLHNRSGCDGSFRQLCFD